MENTSRFTYNAETKMKKRKFITVFGFIVSIVLLYFAVRGIEFREIWTTLGKTKPVLAFVPIVSDE